jgi:hypothetical protein
MSTYLISFRLEYDSNYAERWASVVDAIRSQASGSTWEELTSLVILKSSKDAESIALAIYLGSQLNSMTDTLLVVNAKTGAYATRGQINDPATLESLFKGNPLLDALYGRQA